MKSWSIKPRPVFIKLYDAVEFYLSLIQLKLIQTDEKSPAIGQTYISGFHILTEIMTMYNHYFFSRKC